MMHTLSVELQALPSRPLQQKEQKNFRLTSICIRMLQRIGVVDGHTESAVVERLVRDEFARKGLKLSHEE